MPIRWTKRKVRSSAPNCWTAEQVERLKALLFARVPICVIAATDLQDIVWSVRYAPLSFAPPP